jgi:hypothetical protein
MLLNSLHIKGFRGFTDFKVDGLGQVNLIIGRNNAGKTSLLEAVYLLTAGQGDPFLAINRGEDLAAAHMGLFNRPPMHQQPTGEIEIGSDQETNPFSMKLKQSQIEISRPPWGGTFQIGSSLGGVATTSPVLMEPGAKVAFDIVSLWNRIQFTPHHDALVDCLKLIIPNIIDVAIGNADLKPRARLQGENAPVPLARFGGGATRLFHLACGLVLSAEKACLIEEIDNGLHHSVHARMWAFVLKVSKAYQIQVFATTHGLDCLRGFAQASLESQEIAARVIRLDNHKGDIVPVVFDEEEFQIAAREEIEIR